MVGGGIGRKSELVAEDVVVVVQYRNVPPPKAPVRSHHGVARIEAVEIPAGRVETFGDAVQAHSHLADVERRIQVHPDDVQVAVFVVIAARDLPDQEEIAFAQVSGVLLNRAAKFVRLVEAYMLERVDAEAVAIGQRYPVLVTAREVAERPTAIQLEVAQVEKVRPPVFGLRIVQVARAEIARASPRVIFDVGQLHRPYAVFAALNLRHGLPPVAAPRAERIMSGSITRHKRPARCIRWVETVRDRVAVK